MSEIPIYDPEVLVSLIGDDQPLIEEYKKEFVKQCVPTLRGIAAAFNKNENTEVKDQAHYLKTSAKAIGAMRCAARLQKIEDCALSDDRVSLKQHITLLQNDIRDVKKEFIK
ncbi:Hpt domain-containing protein [Catenovulum sediminis]|uniref:Hpt domain-containing protein n=1 Tax=Catenovulum sediminis TaxID=1740262 RepID=A0ABV1RGE3_9ALTE|nr:Hpt domain-containing protein [Catenovulum sediminis]